MVRIHAALAILPLTVAEMKNRDGKWVKPTPEAVSAAAAKTQMPDDFRVSITDQPGPDAWPIATFTYLLVYRDIPDRVKGEALLHFLWWAEHEGQKFASPLDYAPLPQSVVHKVEQTLRKITVQGKAGLAARK